jgi:hypothetical protein
MMVRNLPGMPVILRSNDAFVKKYSSEMTVWTDQYPFYLADWRYRIRATDGSYTAYTFAPKLTALSLADVFAAMPPDDCKNPLIPGNTPTLKFWEFNGNIWMPQDLVKGWDGSARSVKAVLYNGTKENLAEFLEIPTPQDPIDPEEPGDIDPPTNPVDQGKTEEILSRIEVLLGQIAADLHAIRIVFRE